MRGNRATCSLIFLLSFLLMFSEQSHADQVSIGFPELPPSLNILIDDHPAAVFARKALAMSLTLNAEPSKENSANFRLSLAKNMSVSANFSNWSFKINTQFSFPNDQVQDSEDVLWSLKRCMQHGVLPEVSHVSLKQPPDSSVSSDGPEVVITLATERLTIEQLKEFPRKLADCPILERSSSITFGEELGRGSSLVAAGPFVIADFNPGLNITLGRRESELGVENDGVVLKGFASSAQALSALRAGSLAALFSKDPEVLARAEKDETLLLQECSTYSVVVRKGFNFSCDPRADTDSLKYLNLP